MFNKVMWKLVSRVYLLTIITFLPSLRCGRVQTTRWIKRSPLQRKHDVRQRGGFLYVRVSSGLR